MRVRAAIARIPANRRKVISAHDAFGYFAAAYGIAFIAPQGVSTESEPSAQDVAAVITQIRQQKIPAIFLENISDPRLIHQIASETGAAVGGTLFPDSLTDAKGAAPSYIDMMRHNVTTITAARMTPTPVTITSRASTSTCGSTCTPSPTSWSRSPPIS